MSGYGEVELAWRTHDTASAAIDKADTKAGFAATVTTAVTAVVLTLVSQSHTAPTGVRVLFGLSLVALAVALVAAVLVVTPRLTKPGKELVPGEFLYFGATRLRSIEQLRRHLAPQGRAERVAEPWEAVAHQAKRLSSIAWTKLRYLQVAFLALVVGGFLAAAGVLLGGGR